MRALVGWIRRKLGAAPNIEEYERSTLALLERAFPRGLGAGERLAVMECLQPHMSQRNLADVLVLFTHDDYARLINEVYGVGGRELDRALVNRVARTLEDAGFDEWRRTVN